MKKHLLITGSFLFLIHCSQPVNGQQLPSSLKDAYKEAFLVGTAINSAIVNGSDSATMDIVLHQFNTITSENVLKAGPINPRPGVYNFGPADKYVEFGEEHGMFIVGPPSGGAAAPLSGPGPGATPTPCPSRCGAWP